MFFKIGDIVRVINKNDYFYDKISTIRNIILPRKYPIVLKFEENFNATYDEYSLKLIERKNGQ